MQLVDLQACSNPTLFEAGSKCVLVVEDDDTIRSLIAEVLDRAGYQVERAADGVQALAKLKSARPDVIVLDLMMPVMDGWTFLVHMRQDPDHGATPVVVTSAYGSMTDTAAELHVQGYLAKPFDVDALVSVVHRLL